MITSADFDMTLDGNSVLASLVSAVIYSDCLASARRGVAAAGLQQPGHTARMYFVEPAEYLARAAIAVSTFGE